MWSLKPFAVVMDPTPDTVSALFLAAQAKEQGIVVLHHVGGADQFPCDISSERSKPATAVVEALMAAVNRDA